MKSLFAKILGWFLITLFVAVSASMGVAVLSDNPKAKLHAPFSLLLQLGLADASHAWERDGREGLRESIVRFKQATRASTVALTDANGIDLLTGEPHPTLIQGARAFSRIPFLRRGELAFPRFSQDGKYCFFLIMSPSQVVLSSVQPLHVAVIGAVVFLCYTLAYYLTAPIRALRTAMDDFGHGNLKSRAAENRSDELGDLARAFNRMAERIQAVVGFERRLLLDISHELRSPLARLGVAIELARSGQGRALPLDRIQKEAERLNDLIGQMLQVARLETQVPRAMAQLRLDELVRDIINDCSIEASAHGCALVFPIPSDLIVMGEPELLRRAIENVLRNAIRYAPPESKIEIALESGGGRARLRIRDYGPGVPEDALPHLFDPFFRVETDRNRANGGVGLGLSIAWRAVELHKGKLRATNVNPGLQVEIELPG